MERRKFLKGSAVGIGAGALASSLVAKASDEHKAEPSTPTLRPLGRPEDFIVPSGNIIILTDAENSAAVFATPAPYVFKGVMLSRGATRLLKESWFGGTDLVPALTVETANGLAPGSVAGWISLHPGLKLADKPVAWPTSEVYVDQPQTLSVDGLKTIELGLGKLITRRIGAQTVYYHEAAQSLPAGTVPIIDELISIPADSDVATARFKASAYQIHAANKCAACASCAVCAGCVFCAEVNFYVGAVGTAGLIGLAGLASSIPLPGGTNA
jgi:hypothetical protein